MGKKKVSVGAWAYIWGGYAEEPIPLTTVVKGLQELGFDGVEMAAFPPHLAPEDFPTQASRKEIKKLLDDHGLEVSGLAADFNKVPPALAKPTDYIEVVMTNLDICHDLDIPKLRVDTISPPTEIPGGMDLFAHMLTGKIGHVHFIDSDETLHDGHTSTHAPFGQGVLDFGEIIKALEEAGYTDDWWPMDLYFWPNALEATAPAKKFMDELVAKYGQD